ncbi:MAG: hypothetical protein ABSA66_10375 [Roseiarcus sp.]|jgi:multidrug resistance efflux pump
MSDLNGIETARPAFDAFTTLLAIMGDPRAYKANMDALKAKLEAIAEAETKLAADRAAFAAETAAAKAEVAEDRRRAAGAWRAAQEAERKAAGLTERAEAYAAKVGYHERPTRVDIGTSGGGMVMLDEAPMRQASAALAPEMVAEDFGGGQSGGRMIERPSAAHIRGRA